MGLAPGRNIVTKARDAALRAAVPLFVASAPSARWRAPARPSGFRPRRSRSARCVFSPQLVVASGSPTARLRPNATGQRTCASSGDSRPTPRRRRCPAWWADLDGRTVVHVTQGTQNIDPADLIRPALEALADRDVLVVVATGVPGRDALPFAVPANVRVAGFLPYAALLPRVDVMVTNGGWGGTLAALSHGIPLVIAGGDLDKPEIAARVAWSGAGVNLKTGTPTAAQVAAGVRPAGGRCVVPGCRRPRRRRAQLARRSAARRGAARDAPLRPAALAELLKIGASRRRSATGFRPTSTRS